MAIKETSRCSVKRESGTLGMTIEDDINFHSERAMAELDRALEARCVTASQAHFQLSSLHLDRMRNLKASSHATAGSVQ
jgi:hypothetical protein